MNARAEPAVAPDDGAKLFERMHRRSAVWLTLFAAVLLFGSVMRSDAEHAVLLGLEGPHCLVKRLVGEDACPGCGLTRSVTLVLHGEWRQAWVLHPAGFLIVALCIGGVLVHGNILLRRRRTEGHGRVLSIGYRIFVLGILLSWLGRVLS